MLNKLEELKLQLTTHSGSIFAVCETWLDDSVPDSLIHIDGFTVYRKDRDLHGGGVAVYIADFYDCMPLSDNEVPYLAATKSEVLSIFIRPINILFTVIYHPFWGPPSMLEHLSAVNCITDIHNYASIHLPLSECGRPFHIVCGDFNDLRFLIPELCDSLSLTSIVDFPTRANSTLDHFLITDSSKFQLPVPLAPLGRSDHCVILLQPHRSIKPITIKKTSRKITPRTLAMFQDKMESTKWVEVVQVEDVDEAASSFLLTLKSIFDSCFPEVAYRLRPDDKPWITPRIKMIINQRDRAYKEKKTLKYLRLRDQVRSEILRAKSNYANGRAVTDKDTKQTQMWKSVNDLCGRALRDKHHVDVSFISDIFQKSFNHDHLDDSSWRSNLSLCPSASIDITIEEVSSLLSEAKKGATGIDGIPHWVLRQYRHILAPAVRLLFQASISKCTYPLAFKLAQVIPIPKAAKPRPEEFRPISLLPIISKLLEKLVLKRWLIPHVLNKMDPQQFAFVPGRGKGTICALTLLNHHILSHLDKPGAVRAILLDYTKAFDKVTHSTILSSLTHLQAPQEAICWIHSYLTGRCQQVKNGKLRSEWAIVPSGVPQGSVLGPFLFATVINSLRPLSPNATYIKYADDLTILIKMRDSSEDSSKQEMDHIMRWSDNNSLLLNIKKCLTLDLCTKTNLKLSPLTTSNGFILPSVTQARILGVHFSSDLKWSHHINIMCTRANQRLYVLRALKRVNCNTHRCWIIYEALIRSLLTYSCQAWCNASKSDIAKIVKLEKKAEKIIGCPPPQSITEVIEKQCHKLGDTIKKGGNHHPLHPLFDWKVYRRSSRLNGDSKAALTSTHFAHTSRFKNSFIKFA
jgi:hypothetical protein